MTSVPRIRRLWPLIVLVCLPCLFLWRVAFTGKVLVPAGLLRYVAPWSALAPPDSRPPWNPLLYDSVGQFYPWRHFAADCLRSGVLPLWNPCQFCGAPFVANSQSAVFYPGNLLHCVLPTAAAAGWTALLHLALAGVFTWLFLRRLGLGGPAATFGGAAFALCTWQVAWLGLPTFLDTSCWLPLILLLTHRLFEHPGWSRAAGLGFAVGMALLAGHLQIAAYVLLSAALYAAGLALRRAQAQSVRAVVAPIALFAAACALGFGLAAPQVIPALELARVSHRRAVPSPQGYAAYTAYAVPANALVTAFLPDFYGNPSDPSAPYFGASRGGMLFNYAEGAMYVGLPALVFGMFALVAGVRSDRRAAWFAGLALLALLMALGTAVDALFYFYVPGFGQSGSPGRVLVLWSFAMACLGALGCERAASACSGRLRHAAAAVAVTGLLAIGAYLLGTAAVRASGIGEDVWHPQLVRQGALFALSAGLLLALAYGGLRRAPAAALPVALLAVDLFANGANFNPAADPADVYPATAAIRHLQERAGHDRIMPVNTNWSFAGPTAVLPPNGATVFGLRDVQGYDSLFPGQYKRFMDRLAGPGRDASPPEVGNMVFAKNAGSPLALEAGVRCIASVAPLDLPGPSPTVLDGAYLYDVPGAPGRAVARTDDGRTGRLAWAEDGPTRAALLVAAPAPALLSLADQYYPGWQATVDGRPAPIERADVFRRVQVPAGTHTVVFSYRPAGFRLGLYLSVLAWGVGAFALLTTKPRRGGRVTG